MGRISIDESQMEMKRIAPIVTYVKGRKIYKYQALTFAFLIKIFFFVI